jgi:hypothetical protein
MKSRMTSLSRTTVVFAVFALGAFGSSSAYAQDQPEENANPKPAARAPIIDTNDAQDTNSNPDALQPDNAPLTGVQNPGLGSSEFRHSYWVPGIQAATTAQSGGTHGDWFDTTYLAGNLSLSAARSHSHLALNYSGGGYFSTEDSQGNGSYQQVGLAQTFNWQRWRLDFFDQFSYLPTSAFGFGGASGIGIPGIGGSLAPGSTGLGGNYVPEQGILASTGPRYSNSFATQATFLLSQRGSITVVGSYGILRFTEAGNIDNDDAIGSIGYNYAISRKDSVGVLYRFSAFHYSGLSQAIGVHDFNLAYSRKVTGRLGLALFAGPEITTFRIPIGTSTDHFGLSFGASLSYGFERGSVTLEYTHGTNGGSGILAGGAGDHVNAIATRQLGRIWQARGKLGYARLHGFSSSGISAPAYNSFYLGAGLDRPIGRNAVVNFGYTAYIQNNNQAACGGAGACGSTYTQHQVAVSFQWHTRPFVLR